MPHGTRKGGDTTSSWFTQKLGRISGFATSNVSPMRSRFRNIVTITAGGAGSAARAPPPLCRWDSTCNQVLDIWQPIMRKKRLQPATLMENVSLPVTMQGPAIISRHCYDVTDHSGPICMANMCIYANLIPIQLFALPTLPLLSPQPTQLHFWSEMFHSSIMCFLKPVFVCFWPPNEAHLVWRRWRRHYMLQTCALFGGPSDDQWLCLLSGCQTLISEGDMIWLYTVLAVL